MTKPKAPPTQILPQEWQNPKPPRAVAPEIVYPMPQEKAEAFKAITMPHLPPYDHVPTDPAPVERPPEPDPALPAAVQPLRIDEIRDGDARFVPPQMWNPVKE